MVGQRRANILKDALFQGEKPSSLETQKLTRAPGGRKGCLGVTHVAAHEGRVDVRRSLRLRILPGGEPVPWRGPRWRRACSGVVEMALGSSRQLASKLELGD